jgi:hypothetical protein
MQVRHNKELFRKTLSSTNIHRHQQTLFSVNLCGSMQRNTQDAFHAKEERTVYAKTIMEKY